MAATGESQLLHRMANESKAKLKARFKSHDENGDGNLNVEELTTLLNKGSSKFTQMEVRALFNACDVDKNGTIGFDEFVNFVHQDQAVIDMIVNNANGGRNILRRTPSELADADVHAMQQVFDCYTGHSNREGVKEMKGNEFMRFCRSCDLFCDGFDHSEVDIVFAKVCRTNRRSIGPEEFRMAVKFIAEMRGEPGISVRSRIVDRTKLYVPSATQPATNAPGIDRLSQPKVRRNHGLDIIKMDMPNPLEGRFDKRPSAKTRLASPARTSVGALSSGRLRTTSKTSPIDDGAGVPVAKTKVESGLTAVRRSLRDRDSPLRRGRRALSSGCLRVSAEDDGAPMTKAKSETAAGRTRESSAALWSRALSAPRVAMLPTMRGSLPQLARAAEGRGESSSLAKPGSRPSSGSRSSSATRPSGSRSSSATLKSSAAEDAMLVMQELEATSLAVEAGVCSSTVQESHLRSRCGPVVDSGRT